MNGGEKRCISECWTVAKTTGSSTYFTRKHSFGPCMSSASYKLEPCIKQKKAVRMTDMYEDDRESKELQQQLRTTALTHITNFRKHSKDIYFLCSAIIYACMRRAERNLKAVRIAANIAHMAPPTIPVTYVKFRPTLPAFDKSVWRWPASWMFLWNQNRAFGTWWTVGFCNTSTLFP